MFILNEKTQNFKPSYENKTTYGEVNTPYSLIDEMLDLIERNEPDVFKQSHYKWLDPACGLGYYIFSLYNRLFIGLECVIKDDDERTKHIFENMLYFCEINEENIKLMKKEIKEKIHISIQLNVFSEDFLSMTLKKFNIGSKNKSKNTKDVIGFDYIIGNPPYNCNGLKKVPTLKNKNKKHDGVTIWDAFVKHSLSLLKNETGNLSFIIPSIWMKPDKAGNYNIFTSEQYNLKYIRTFDNTTTNKIFKQQAQTPTCYFILQKRPKREEYGKHFYIFDSLCNKYILYKHIHGKPIPLDYPSIFNYLNKYSSITPLSHIIQKTNMPNKKISISDLKNEKHQFINIHTCKLRHETPYLDIKYSDLPCAFYNKPKIILAHKMYGFPYYDCSGVYGICNRDSYIITIENLGYNKYEITLLLDFLNCSFTRFLFEATRYRMKYLEKYIFELLPNIVELNRKYSIFDIINGENYKLRKFLGFLCIEEELLNNILNNIIKKKNYDLF